MFDCTGNTWCSLNGSDFDRSRYFKEEDIESDFQFLEDYEPEQSLNSYKLAADVVVKIFNTFRAEQLNFSMADLFEKIESKQERCNQQDNAIQALKDLFTHYKKKRMFTRVGGMDKESFLIVLALFDHLYGISGVLKNDMLPYTIHYGSDSLCRY